MTRTPPDEPDYIEISARQRDRIEHIKAECGNAYLPDPTDQQIIKSLLDTWDALGDGYYSECECSIDPPTEQTTLEDTSQ